MKRRGVLRILGCREEESNHIAVTSEGSSTQIKSNRYTIIHRQCPAAFRSELIGLVINTDWKSTPTPQDRIELDIELDIPKESTVPEVVSNRPKQ